MRRVYLTFANLSWRIEPAREARAWMGPARIGAALASAAPDDYISSRSVIPAEPEKSPPARRAA